MRTAGALVLMLAALAACEPAAVRPRMPSEIYSFHLLTSPPSVLRWPSGTTVRVYPDAANPQQRALLADALAAGAAEWNRHALFGEYRIVEATSLAQADVLLRWSTDLLPLDMADCQPTGGNAVTTFCTTPGGPGVSRLRAFPRLDGTPTQVRMVVTVLFAQTQVPGRVQSLVTHELGHVLGLAQHSQDERDLMSSQQLTRTTLSMRDIATVQTLYHMEPDIVP